MASFAFVPRKIARTTTRRIQNGKCAEASADGTRSVELKYPHITHQQTQLNEPESPSPKKVEQSDEKAKLLSDKEYAILLRLVLSDYSIETNLSLRGEIECVADGYLPLSYLMTLCPLSSYLTPRPPEIALIRSIRSFAGDFFEARMIITGPSSRTWGLTGKSDRDDQGGYEVRRKDWKNITNVVRHRSEDFWQERSIYVENLPSNTRTVPSITELFHQMLPQKSTSSMFQIQSIDFPPHYNDPPGTPMASSSKGFAFVVLNSLECAKYLEDCWSWDCRDRQVASETENCDGILKSLEHSGFRTLSKSRWETLKKEYLSRKQDLLAQLVADSRMSTVEHTPSFSVYNNSESVIPVNDERIVSDIQGRLSTPTDFPTDCLVFIKNVHPGTNKTTLRTLLSKAFQCDSPADRISYVDYNKGMDTCYIRLTSPEHSNAVISYVSSRSFMQKDGLDVAGTTDIPGSQMHIQAELIQGKREKIYWEKVPSKVKQEALSLSRNKDFAEMQEDNVLNSKRTQGKKRKR